MFVEWSCTKHTFCPNLSRSVRVAERLAVLTSDHRVAGSNPTGGEILPEPKRRFIAQSLSCSPFHRLEMTEILLKGCKTLTHPSIHPNLSIWLVVMAIKRLNLRKILKNSSPQRLYGGWSWNCAKMFVALASTKLLFFIAVAYAFWLLWQPGFHRLIMG